MAKLLLSKGANAALKDSAGRNIALVKFLHNISFGREHVQPMVALLLSHGACDSAETATMFLPGLAGSCDSTTANVLLQASANPNAKDSKGLTAIDSAARECNIETVKTLVGFGADSHVKDSQSCTTLHAIAGGETLRGIDYAVAGDEIPQYKREDIRTELATYFLTLGVDVDALDVENGTAIVAASARGHVDLVKLFLDNGANVHLRSAKHGTANEASEFQGHEKIVQILTGASLPGSG